MTALDPLATELLELAVAAGASKPLDRATLERFAAKLTALDPRAFVAAADDILRAACILDGEEELTRHAAPLRAIVTRTMRRQVAREGQTHALASHGEAVRDAFEKFLGEGRRRLRTG